MQDRKINAYLGPGRVRHGSTDPTAGRVLKRTLLMQAMADKIRRAGRRSRYRLRKQVVEPVFEQEKHARGCTPRSPDPRHDMKTSRFFTHKPGLAGLTSAGVGNSRIGLES